MRPFYFQLDSRQPVVRPLGLLAGLALPALAQKVVVTPDRQMFFAGTSAATSPEDKARYQFHATLESAGTRPVHWTWKLEGADRQAAADVGSISQEGVYTPPAVSLPDFLGIWVIATPQGFSLPSGEVPSGRAIIAVRPATVLHQAKGTALHGKPRLRPHPWRRVAGPVPDGGRGRARGGQDPVLVLR